MGRHFYGKGSIDFTRSAAHAQFVQGDRILAAASSTARLIGRVAQEREWLGTVVQSSSFR
jgi:hypothetical protein